MPEEKEKIVENSECEACQALGDYMCAGMPGDRAIGAGNSWSRR